MYHLGFEFSIKKAIIKKYFYASEVSLANSAILKNDNIIFSLHQVRLSFITVWGIQKGLSAANVERQDNLSLLYSGK